MATGRQFFRPRVIEGERRKGSGAPLPLVLLIAFGLGGVAVFGLRDSGLSNWLLDAPVPQQAAYAARSFPICGGGVRTTCVVDGDTFWLDGVKIRIADINTPETGSPQCAAEAALGRQATQRLAELLRAGPFSLGAIERDEDRYGRKLRVVLREGRSLGAQLVAEGLAERWTGQRRTWC
jgi:endonuclease YncB( thermonuclease family)